MMKSKAVIRMRFRWAGILSMFLLLAGCGAEASVAILPDPVPDQAMAGMKEGISMTVSDVRTDGEQAVIAYSLENRRAEPVGCGGYAAIEKLESDGWHGVIYSDAVFYRKPGFRDFGKTLAPGAEKVQLLDTAELGVELPPGRYRLVKTVVADGGSGTKISVASEFDIAP